MIETHVSQVQGIADLALESLEQHIHCNLETQIQNVDIQRLFKDWI